MLEFCSLYSGSTGNSLLVKSNNTKLLIDAGISKKKIIDALKLNNIELTQIDAILVTHEHTDHIHSIGTISNGYNIPVYANEKTWSVIPTKQKEKISTQNQKVFLVSQKFLIGDIEILPFSIPHDAVDPCGFNIYNNTTKISIATDLGHVTPSILENLKNSSFVLLESNYDPDILKYCTYPASLKKRIIGPNGHLSNILASKTISELVHTGLKSVMLGHLSKENNFPELAYKTVIEQLVLNNINEDTINLSVASRFSPTPMIKIS